MKNFLFILLFFLIFLTISQLPSFASSSYVLPYPSTMPGGISYKVHLLWETVLKYWYFGDFGQFHYDLNQSDKYLVEAKTLFEYQQYLLGYAALEKSNIYFVQIAPTLHHAQRENKPTAQFYEILKSASQKHIETLVKMKEETPESFLWQPEKVKSTNLDLHNAIDTAIRIRMQDL